MLIELKLNVADKEIDSYSYSYLIGLHVNHIGISFIVKDCFGFNHLPEPKATM